LANGTDRIAFIVGGPSGGGIAQDYFQIRSAYNVATADILKVASTGFVGINTTAPLCRLAIGDGSLTDGNVSCQMNAAAGGEANFGVNKAGAYGFLLGLKNTTAGYPNVGPFGYLRMVTSDPFTIMINNTKISTLWASDTSVALGGTITDKTLYTGGILLVKATGLLGMNQLVPTASFHLGSVVLTSGTGKSLIVDPAAHTNQTASTEINNVAFNAYTRTWATGNITSQRV